jgi:DNA-binding transcriptional LysR family regulator
MRHFDMRWRMDWRSVKFDWNQARAFLVTAEEGSLSAAARALGMSQPTLGRQVDALEEELGVVLFERAGRGLVLTPNGLELLDYVRAMGDAASRVSLAASGKAEAIAGTISITGSEIYCAHLLPEIVGKLRRAQPAIEIEIVASNQTVDLRRREADIAIRSYRPTQPELIAKKVADDPARFYATPGYLKRIGNPKDAKALSASAEFIAFEHGTRFVDAYNALGLSISQDRLPLTTLNHLVHWEMVRAGIAVGMAPESIGDRDRKVVRVLPHELKPMPFEIWLTTHRELNTSRRVRTVFDFLAAELSARLAPAIVA